MSNTYNWNDASVVLQGPGYNETAYSDGKYLVDIDENTYVQKMFVSVPESGIYTHEYHIQKIKITGDSGSDWVFVYMPKYDDGTNTNLTNLFTIGVQKTSSGCATFAYFGDSIISHNYPLTNEGIYEINFKINSETGDYSFHSTLYASDGSYLDSYGTTGTVSSPPGISITTAIIEHHEYNVPSGTNILFDMIKSPIVKGISLISDVVLYADISDNVPGGDGSISNPLNFGQLWNDVQNNLSNPLVLGNKYTYRIKGIHNHPSSAKNMFGVVGLNPDSDIFIRDKIVFEGWGVDIYGPPVFKWNYSPYDEAHIMCGDLSWFTVSQLSTTTSNPELDIEFKDIVVQSKEIFNCSVNFNVSDLFTVNVTYKDVCVVTNDIYTDIGYSDGISNRNITFFGCTFNANTLHLNGQSSVNIYDSILNIDDMTSLPPNNHMSAPKVSMNNYLITTEDVKFSPDTDVTDYIFTPDMYDNSIDRIPNYDNFSIFTNIVTDKGLMLYNNFGVPKYNTPAIRQIREDNNYNNGLFGGTRETYGAYGMEHELPFYATSGHIGAFYFGPDYTNVDTTSTSFINIIPSNTNVGISKAIDISDTYINMVVPNKKFVIAQDNFIIDFVAKEVHSDVYPKFCKAEHDKCVKSVTYDTDLELYRKQIKGGNPLTVNVSAYAKSSGEMEFYKPVTYNWYFDYYNKPYEYVSCAGPSATHIYCGGYLDEYDIRLCVEFQ